MTDAARRQPPDCRSAGAAPCGDTGLAGDGRTDPARVLGASCIVDRTCDHRRADGALRPAGPHGAGTSGGRFPFPLGLAARTPRSTRAGRDDFLGAPDRCSAPLYLAAVVTVFFYLLSSLYDERKDRSILFWKSLPVSDAATVLSKLLVALVVVPLGVFVAALVTNMLQRWVWDIRYALGLEAARSSSGIRSPGLKVEAFMLLVLVLAVLWYAPIAAYLMVISAWARRNVFLWAVLPPVILWVVETIAFGTRYVRDLLVYRLGGVWSICRNNFRGHGVPDGSFWKQHRLSPRCSTSSASPDLFTNIDLWLGLIVAAALVYAAIRIRRYRDDT